MRKLFIIGFVLLFVVALVIVFSSEQQVTEPADEGYDLISLTLKVNAPFSTNEITISKPNKQLSYTYTSRQQGIVTSEDQKIITDEQHDMLETILNEGDFWNFRREYINPNLQDDILYEVEAMGVTRINPELADAFYYTVGCQKSACPEVISELVKYVYTLQGEGFPEVGV